MNERHVVDQLLAYVSANLDDASSRTVKDHLASCDACRREYESLTGLWDELGRIPEEQPGDGLGKSFHDMLRGYERGVRHSERRSMYREWFGRPAFQLGFAAVMVFVGLLCGYNLNGGNRNAQDTVQLREEVRELRNLLTMSLLHQESASERLKGVSWSHRFDGTDPEIIAALVRTMKYDPNVNVRLAALNALSRDIDHPAVRREIISTLPQQASPLMQMALVDLLVQLNDADSRDVLQRALKQPGLNPEVMKRMKLGIQVIL